MSDPRKKSLLERASDVLDLPTYAMVGLPLIELTGDNALRVENHRGILSYSEEEIHISGGDIIYKIQGRTLELRTMTSLELLITGQITAITLE
ncbi:MAG: YabP/YqfC family sporulation protein [Eubacteriales bacterium]